MALKIGQLRKTDISQNVNIVDWEGTTVPTPSPFDSEDSEKSFTDFAIHATNGFVKGKVYYCRFKIKQVRQGYYSQELTQASESNNTIDRLEYSIVLQGNNNSMKTLAKFFVPINPDQDTDKYFLYEIMFSPLVNSSNLILKLNRIAYDYYHKERNWLTEDNSNFILNNNSTETILCELNNLIPSDEYWKKFGFQTRPSTLIAVNKEPMRVGRSGIYELNNGTKITSFMIAPSNNNEIEHFLLDYIAVEEEGEDA